MTRQARSLRQGDDAHLWLEAAAAVSDSGRWDGLLHLLAASLNATAVALHTVGGDIEVRHLVAGSGLPEGIWERYAEGGWHAQDPWVASLSWLPVRSGAAFVGRTVCDWPVLERTDYYHAFAAPHGIRSNLTLIVDDARCAEAAPQTLMSLYRRPGLDEFSTEDVHTLARLHGPLRLALHAHWALAWPQQARQAAVHTLAAIPKSLLVLDAQGRVLHANTRAEALLRAGTWLRIRGGHLWPSDTAWHGAWTAALREAAGGRLQALRVAGPSQGQGDAPTLRLVPLDETHACWQAWPQARVLLLVDVAEADGMQQLWQAFVRRHRLTPAETRVLHALAQGHTVAQVAEQAGTSVHTVRFQLRQLFDKTGTRRQSALLQLAPRPPHCDA